MEEADRQTQELNQQQQQVHEQLIAEQQQQYQQQQQQQHFQPLMTKLAVQLLPPSSHGGSTGSDPYLHQTLIHRSGHCYQLHRPHLALPVQPASQPPTGGPHELLKADHYSNDHHHHQQQQQQQQQPMLAAPVSLDRYMPPSHHLHHQQQHHIQRQHDTGQHQLGPAGIRHLVDNLSRNVVHKRTKTSSQRQQSNQNQRVHISCLYPEILAMIFSKLSVRDRGRAAQVCHAWREAAFHRSAWRNVEAKLHLRKHSTPVFNCLEKRGIKQVQVLSLTMRRGLGDVFRCLSKLQSLSLSGCYNMSDSGLNSALNQKYPALTELNLSLCKNITDASLDRIAHCLVNLEVLEIGGCGNITNAGLHVIAWGLKKLKKLDLRSCWHITDLGISYLAGLNDDNGLGTFALEHLGLQDCQRLSDEALKHISIGLSKSLKSINLSFCVLVTDSGMKHLAKISSLRELNLRSCDNITEIGMAYLAEGGSRVTSLDVSFCDKIGDLALQNISQGLFHLKSLSLSACPISDEGIRMIAKSQHELETLHIGQCSRLTDRGVFVIVEHMPKLRAIDLYGCIHISKEGIKMICDLPLVSLNLGLWQEKR